jgi:hypothetical protein
MKLEVTIGRTSKYLECTQQVSIGEELDLEMASFEVTAAVRGGRLSIDIYGFTDL